MNSYIDTELQFVPDLVFLEDQLPFKKKQYLLGSTQNNSYLKVDYKQYQVLKRIQEYTQNGIIKLRDIEEKLLLEEKVQLNGSKLINTLEKHCLLSGSSRNNKNSEAERIGYIICKSPFSLVNIPNIKQRLIFFLFAIVFLSFCFACTRISTIWNNFFSHQFTIHKSSLLGFMISGFISLITIFMHEWGHIFAAKSIGMKEGKFAVILYAYFIPTYYTRYDGIEIKPFRDRMKVLSAGLKVNIILFFLAFSLLAIPEQSGLYYDVLAKIVLINVQFITINLSPFAMNDGYFILLNILGISTLRLKMWDILAGVIKGKNNTIDIKNKGIIFFYTLVSFMFLGFNVFILGEWGRNILIELFFRGV